ncbi:MAG TPA: phosphodiester glycosidase family protein [Streptosporangiaceae bacterium]|nr:phosphodiester glycosidase family protein [Streptosporangiaceae bacterium]
MTTRSASAAAPVKLALAVAVLCGLVGCAAATAGPAGAGHAGAGGQTGAGAARSGAAGPGAETAGPSEPGSSAVTTTPGPAKVIVTQVVLADGHLMTVARFTGSVRLVLHCGSTDPGRRCPNSLSAGPAVARSDRRLLVAAFNGGFKLSAQVGGYEQEGRIISPLVPGRASLVIDSSGAASIGIWGQDVPKPGESVYSVRQNLNSLVSNGQPTAAAFGNWKEWGGTLTGVDDTARSALGQNASGQLIYVASMSATPVDLAQTLVRFGARIGMELDINPEWVQLAYSRKAGGPLTSGVTGQVRPADQYLVGWTRDFVAVLANWVPTPGPGIHIRS